MHEPVLLKETIEGLNLKRGSTFIDGTLGAGGHSEYACKEVPGIRIIGLDQDSEALEIAKEKLQKSGCNIQVFQSNFRNFDAVLKKTEIGGVDAILLDIGLSSMQLDSSGRGFSFRKDEPLLMTMKSNLEEGDITAREIVNEWGENSIADIIYGYGEERYARRIAKKIAERRKEKPIETTHELVEIIKSAVPAPYTRKRTHFATKTFQALRITVNDELGALQEALLKSVSALTKNGRIAVITFHSLEDRIVKRFFLGKEKEGMLKRINKKPIIPEDQEIEKNIRARSAKLRIAEKQ